MSDQPSFFAPRGGGCDNAEVRKKKHGFLDRLIFRWKNKDVGPFRKQEGTQVMNEEKSNMNATDILADNGTTPVRDRDGRKKIRPIFKALILCAAAVTFGWYLCHEIHEVRNALFLLSWDFSKFTKSFSKTADKVGTEQQPVVFPDSSAENRIRNKLRDIEDKIDKLQVATSPKKDVVQASPDLGYVQDAIAEAQRLESAGDHAMAGYYWRNALEHAGDAEMLSVLGKYAEALSKAKADDEALYTEATTLERLSELALVRVSPKEMGDAIKLRDSCVAFRTELGTRLSADLAEDDTDNDQPERHPALIVADQIEALLKELQDCINKYQPGDRTGSPKELECKILQLSGVVETSMSQLWFIDRSDLNASDKVKIDGFPKRLNDEITRFNIAHDQPLNKLIADYATGRPPKRHSRHPHQDSIDYYTNNFALATKLARELRGSKAQVEAQELLAGLMKKVSDEKRQQMNEYQTFVANCCKLAYDAWDEMNTGWAGYGRVPKNKGYKNEGDFINRYVRDFAEKVPLEALRSQTDFRLVYNKDNWIPDALQRSSGGPSYWDVKNEHKAFIITAIYGFYRIDQSLLTPETARLFNDVFGKYYEKMDAARKAWSVRWMVEEPKIRLEDF